MILSRILQHIVRFLKWCFGLISFICDEMYIILEELHFNLSKKIGDED